MPLFRRFLMCLHGRHVRSVRSFLAGLGAFVVLLLPGPAVAQEEQDPFSLGDAFPPRVVVIDSLPSGDGGADVSAVVLRDATGRRIPLTGPGAEFTGGVLEVYPPRLPAGSYTVEYPGGSYTFDVGTPRPEGPSRTDGSRGFFWLLPLLAFVPAIVLVARRRRIAGLLVGFLGAGSATGLFLLVSPSGSALPQGDPCLGRQDLVVCATEYVVGVLEDFGPSTATEELLRLSGAAGSPWARICHEPAHELGIRTWTSTGSLDEAIRAGTTSCSLGYVHGLLQAMGTYLDDDEFPSAARGLCDGIDARYRAGELVDGVVAGAGPSTLLGCHHGVGHAAMWRFNEDLERAAPVCAGFGDATQQEECRVGAVMEWVYASQRATRSNSPRDLPSPRVAQPIELCLPPIGVLSPGCVEGAVTAVGPDDVTATAEWCVTQPDVLDACVQSLARRMVQMDLSENADMLASAPKFCASFGNKYSASACAERFAYMLLFLSRDMNRTEDFCGTFPSEVTNDCFKGIQRVLTYAQQTGDDSFNFGE